VRHTLTIRETLFRQLTAAIFSEAGLEGAAYVFCGVSECDREIRLLAKEIVPLATEHYLLREPLRLSIASESYVRMAKRARDSGEAVLFVHSHPAGYPDFSKQDDREEPKLHSFLRSRAPDRPHGSLVFNSENSCQGRIYSDGNTWTPIDRIRVLGDRFRFIDRVGQENPLPEFFDRQVRAFGPDIQRLLGRVHVGVVGAGGTGSAVIEQLCRLGIGAISIFDGEFFDATNATRVYGSSLNDVDAPKTAIQQRNIEQIGFGTKINIVPKHITDETAAKEMRNCDLVFGCTDKQAPRSILVRLALYYFIPVIDVGVSIDSKDGVIRGIWGRVTTLMLEEACLFCRNRIDPVTIRAESLPPDQRDRELQEGYIPQLDTTQPAVITFTTSVASHAVNELLHRLTGFMGSERRSTEVFIAFHDNRIHTNRESPKADCLCQLKENWGKGDSKNFLGRTW
jgi:molybdopterin/thiamine biosynthesis adenylyltransferase/proteasome lid subunit RPN8/RPN11